MGPYSQGAVATDPRHSHSIELELHDLNQLFNSMDPSPFNTRDLDHDAEEFIVSWAHEYPPNQSVTLRIHLERWPSEDPTELIREAVHNYFAYRTKLNDLEFTRLLKQGRTSLLIGLPLLGACLLASKFLLGSEAGTWAAVLRESLTIAGWVAMWRPMQIYLYDWWPVRQRGRVYSKLSRMPVEVIRKERTESSQRGGSGPGAGFGDKSRGNGAELKARAAE